jgi:hypothetical protein
MSTKKKGILSSAPEWWKHLRKFNKKRFWNKEKKAAKRDIKNRLERDGG